VRVDNVPPGEYFRNAAASVESVDGLNRSLLEALATTAIRVTLADGVKTVQNVALSGQPAR